MDFVFILIVSGLSVGSLYALIAIGLNLTFWTTRTLNFSQGSLLMLCAMMTAFFAQSGRSAALMALLALAVVAVAAGLTERFSVRPVLRRVGSMAWVVSTLGVGILLQGVAAKFFGSQALAFPELVLRSSDSVNLGAARVSAQYLLVFGLACAIVLALELFMRLTAWGRATRAVVNDKELASVLGVPVERIVMFSFLASGLLAGIAGLLTAQILGTVDPAFGFDLMILGFVAAVAGGIGNNPGALVGGLLVGVLEKLTAGYVATGASHAVVFAVLIVMLAVRPHGLFGEAEQSKA